MPLPSEMQMADDQFSATHMLKNISEEIGYYTAGTRPFVRLGVRRRRHGAMNEILD